VGTRGLSPLAAAFVFAELRDFMDTMRRRLVGYDNERGKGDHCHLDGIEFPYRFSTPERLWDDFIAEVNKRREP